jgi:hypothetical protein
MTGHQYCPGCNHRIGRRARVLFVVGALLCLDCAGDPAVHKRLLFGCRESHSPRQHGGAVVTAGRAREAIAHP